MRLWSIHPKYLDSKGLVALWREGLLARAVLYGKTRGYINHPQLVRFKKHEDPTIALDTYLLHVYNESVKRRYKFNRMKIGDEFTDLTIDVTDGQITYELQHLKSKLRSRDHQTYQRIKDLKKADPNPIFRVVKGSVEDWEVVGR